MDYKEHAGERISLIFLQIPVAVWVNQIFITVCGELVFLVAVKYGLFDFADQDRVLPFAFRPHDEKTVLSPCVCPYDCGKPVASALVGDKELPPGAFVIGVNVCLS